MALKKSELYSSLWQSCDELRGGMDASQYKDYVLVLLFIKYISDKYAGVPYAPVVVPAGAGFADMIALKGKSTIGDDINKKIIAPLAQANGQLAQADFPDFNDPAKLGSDKEMVDRLTNLIAIFENPALDFSKNRAEGDDILGDAYEYLMRHFATESGKSKGQFYTPAEVSRVIAQVLGIGQAQTSPATTVYDPTCGSGSLLLKVADEAPTPVTLYGQEKDAATSGLARMNMILHNNPSALIHQGNTLTSPHFREAGTLKTFDYVVANPPFSDKRWATGLDPANDEHKRFQPFGVPPAKQGDYAYLLHIVRSLKSTGRGACILPHGVLFRGNAEAEIRRNLVAKGYILGIIGLPPNLFYGTGIPACILVLDKGEAHRRTGIFMIDASAAFAKDGPKNRLRAQDIHKIVDTFARQSDLPGYARLVPLAEIAANDYNLNLPRYIDSSQAEDAQDIAAHLLGGIPERDIDSLAAYWDAFPGLRTALFAPLRPGYSQLTIRPAQLKETILTHPQFVAFSQGLEAHFAAWQQPTVARLKGLGPGVKPKELIRELAEGLLAHYAARPLVDAYPIYQHLMDYWEETMQDDVYLIAAPPEQGGGWVAETYRIVEKDSRGRERDKGWACDLVPKALIVARYFAAEQAEIDRLDGETQNFASLQTELEEEQGGDDGAFAELEKINKSSVTARLKEIGQENSDDPEAQEEIDVLTRWLELAAQQSETKKALKEAETALDAAAYARYPRLTPDEIKGLVVDDKWLAALEAAIHAETQNAASTLTGRIQELAERYADPLPQVSAQVAEWEAKVAAHLERMGYSS